MKLSKILFFLLLTAFQFNLRAQYFDIDSLKNKISKEKDYEKKLHLMGSLSHFYAENNLDSAVYYGKKVLSGGKELNNYTLEFIGYWKLAFAYYTNNHDSPFYAPYMDSAYTIAKNNNITSALAAYYSTYALMERNKFNYSSAINYYLKAKEIYEQMDYNAGVAIIIYNLAEIYLFSGNYNKVISYLTENDSILQDMQLNNYHEYDYIIQIRGITYNLLGNYEKARSDLLESYKRKRNLASRGTEIESYQNLGYAFYYSGQADSAMYFFDKLFEISKEGNDSIYLADYLLLADYLTDRQDYANAEKYLKASLNYFMDIKHYVYLLKTYLKLSNVSELQKEYDQAFLYLHDYVALKDSCFEFEQLDFLVDNVLSEKEIEHLKADIDQLNSDRVFLSDNKNLLYFSSFILLICFFGLWVMQTGLSNVMPTLRKGENPDRWQYEPPTFFPGKKITIALSLVHAFATFSLLAFYSGLQNILLQAIGLSMLSGIAFNLSVNSFYKHLSANNKLPIAKELKLTFLFGISFVLILSLIFTGIQTLLFPPANYAMIVLTNANALFFSLCVQAAIIYRLRFEKQIIQFIAMFNYKLDEQKKNQPQSTGDIVLNLENAGKIERIKLNDVVYVLSENVYQEFICVQEGKVTKILIRNTLNAIENELANYRNFIRCHRSYIVNLDRVTEVQGNSKQQYFITDITKDKIPISRTQAQKILAHFEAFSSN